MQVKHRTWELYLRGEEHDFGWTPPFWFEEDIPDVPFQSNTISGEVLTDKGAKVPGHGYLLTLKIILFGLN